MNRFLIIAFFVAVTILGSVIGSKVFLSETFEEDVFVNGKWILSKNSKYFGQPVKILATGEDIPGFENDKGAQLTQEMKHYGFGFPFPEPIKFTGKDFFVQYEVKFLEAFNCGGAYVKLLRDGAPLEELEGGTPYSIMFGPDRCGATNKVHFILQYQNPIDKTWEEKHFNETIPVRTDKRTHLYTLAIHPDSSFEIFVDAKEVKRGSLLTHMEPSINPPETIYDPEDKKPKDWADDEEIIDETAVKPDDWDESQPRKIPDPNATKPATWLDDEPETIPNPEVVKPEDWDDEADGEWEAPSIPNPKCDQFGCGTWKPPLIENPLYKGKWYPPKIPNPAYKGPWIPRSIPNPTHFVDKNPVDNIAPVTALAVEVWTTNSGVHFDNFIVSDSKDALHKFTAETYRLKYEAEEKLAKDEAKEQRKKERETAYATGSTADKLRAMITTLVEYFTENPFAAILTVLGIVVPFFYIIFFGGKNPSVDVDGNPIPQETTEGESNSEEKAKEAEKKEEPAAVTSEETK